jgi:hypothetical protein
MAMERVRKHLKTKGMRAPIMQKSPETVGSEGVEWLEGLKGVPAAGVSARMRFGIHGRG